LAKIAETILIIRETRTDLGDSIGNVLQAYFNLKNTENRELLKALAIELALAEGTVRRIYSAGEARHEVEEFIGEEHNPGNPRIPGWRRDYELEVEEIRKWRNIIDPTKYVTVCKSAVGYDSLTPSGYTAPVSTQREAISKVVEWMRAHPNPPFPPPYR